MLSVFWDSQGVLLLDFLPHGQTVTGDYYANLLFQLREAIKKKRRGKLTAGPLLLHDNAPPHKTRIARAAIQTSGFEELITLRTALTLLQVTSSCSPNLKMIFVERTFPTTMN